MIDRLIEIVIPDSHKKEMQEILERYGISEFWQDKIADKLILFRVLSSMDTLESFMDLMNRHFNKVDGFKIIVLPVNASLPKSQEKTCSEKPLKNRRRIRELKSANRLSREELLSRCQWDSQLSWIFILMVMISAVVAAIGLMRNNVAIVIGAMVIAPLLGPCVGLSFATTLGNLDLAREALRTLLVGILITLGISILIGIQVAVDPQISEIQSRTVVSLGDIVLALAAGVAGVLSLTSGLSSSLIGVMVAVALLPPLVSSGLLLGSGYGPESFQSMLLFLTNLICINLAGVVTFLVQGIRPRTWWQAKKAKKATLKAMVVWLVLLALLVLMILLSSQNVFW